MRTMLAMEFGTGVIVILCLGADALGGYLYCKKKGLI